MNLVDISRDFYPVYKKFAEQQANLKDIRTFLDLLVKNLRYLTDEQIAELLAIPESIFKNDLKINETLKLDGSYYANNLGRKNPAVAKLSVKFLNSDITSDDMAHFMKYCRLNMNEIGKKLEDYIRIPEVLLENDAHIKDEETFKSAQHVFAQVLKKQLYL